MATGKLGSNEAARSERGIEGTVGVVTQEGEITVEDSSRRPGDGDPAVRRQRDGARTLDVSGKVRADDPTVSETAVQASVREVAHHGKVLVLKGVVRIHAPHGENLAVVLDHHVGRVVVR